MSRELKEVEAALAHDLNNYLQVVMGNLEVLRRRAAFVPEIVDAALSATRNAAQLADRLVAIGRLQHHEPRGLDLNHVLTDLCDMMTRTVGEAVRVELNLAPGLPKAMADPRALQTALLELATNARDAMPQGGRLAIRTASAADNLLMIEVADSGAGMTPEAMARAFEPLLPGGEGPKPAGLGLHIVERCVRQAGGRVELDSQPGKGTRVTMYLPAA